MTIQISLDEVLSDVIGMLPKKRQQVTEDAIEYTKTMAWVPNPGSQTEAFYSDADEIGYGGEAGPGKTDLIVGLSLDQHRRSLVLRRINKEATKLAERYAEILGTRDGWNSQAQVWRLSGNRLVDIGGCEHEDDKQKHKGFPHDLVAFDEVVDFTESQYTFIIQWCRSVDPNQRCRVVATFNPPTKPSGLWVIRRWAPWLDPHYPRPAVSGEIRWFTTIDGKDTEVDGPGPHNVDGDLVMAKSRTFIRGYLSENPELANSNYDATRAAAPKEYRSAYRHGDFEAALEDTEGQMIPTRWVRLAQERWTSLPPEGVPMCAIGVDASGGGDDPMLLAIRHDGWYDNMIEVPGKSIPIERAGKFCAGIITSYRRDGAGVIVDMGGGYGGSIYEHLKANEIDVAMFKGAFASVRRTIDHQYGFSNLRTEAYWRFREALDPDQPGGSPIMLPDDSMLVADLTAATFEERNKVLVMEPKDKVKERLGRSPDRGDAVVMAWHYGARYVTHGKIWGQEHLRRGGSEHGGPSEHHQRTAVHSRQRQARR